MKLTNIDSWPYHVALIYAGGCMILAVLYMPASYYLSRKFLDNVLAALPNSPSAISISRNLKGKGARARIYALAEISGLIIFKSASIRDKEISSEDMKSFPKNYETIIKLEFISGVTMLIWIASIAILAKIREGVPG